MSVKPIYLYPQPVLREKCAEVTAFDVELHQLLDDLTETMKAARNGAGLAAPQIGVAKRALVIDERLKNLKTYDKTESTVIEMVNPKIVSQSKEMLEWELGCLSIPDMYAPVLVPAKATIEAQDRNGETFTMEVEDYFGAGVLHEMDHLDGVLFPDHLSSMKRKLLWERYKKRAARIERELEYPYVSGK